MISSSSWPRLRSCPLRLIDFELAQLGFYDAGVTMTLDDWDVTQHEFTWAAKVRRELFPSLRRRLGIWKKLTAAAVVLCQYSYLVVLLLEQNLPPNILLGPLCSRYPARQVDT